MITSYIVPTRNNPVGLASLLGSIVAHTPPDIKPALFLMDGSDSPVLTSNHIARLVTRFDLTYKHFHEPGLIVQRIAGIRAHSAMYGGAFPFIMVDDDHILLEDPWHALLDFSGDSLFGICVDLLNDKGYKDYAWMVDSYRHHSFNRFDYTGMEVSHKTVVCEELRRFSANAGFFVSTADLGLSKLVELGQRHPGVAPVADDAWALSLASSALLHTALRAIHVGNNNAWWNNHAIKHTAVKQAVNELGAKRDQ